MFETHAYKYDIKCMYRNGIFNSNLAFFHIPRRYKANSCDDLDAYEE